MNEVILIIGSRSNFSKKLHQSIDNSFLVDSTTVLESNDFLENYKNFRISIIVNSFQPSHLLADVKNPVSYIENSVGILANVLDKIPRYDIKKIIYTSSSSVYGDGAYCKENDSLRPANLHSLLKASCEKIVELFCIENDIEYTISRVFNMYGGEDRFSVISKIIDSAISKKVLVVANNGRSIRDFVHVDDVVSCYEAILSLETPKIINIANGAGTSISTILNSLNYRGIVVDTKTVKKREIETSVANIDRLKKIIDTSKFLNVVDFIENRLK
jgi:UDP-glucose 4-epimerase